jgi:hypothetical protein
MAQDELLNGLNSLVTRKESIPEIVALNPGHLKFEIPDSVPADFLKRIPQSFVKNSNGLFVLPDGTGRIYKLRFNNDKIELVRQDSTKFFGYNFGFYAFTFLDKIYSFGGYGYWRYNGHLRVYLPKKGEWEIENLNREIPFSKGSYATPPIWFDQKGGKLWIGYSIDSKEGITRSEKYTEHFTDSVFTLDLKNKEWVNVGFLSEEIRKMATTKTTKSLGSSPWGQLFFDQSTIYLLDFEHNDVLILEDKVTESMIRSFDEGSIFYFRDSTFFVQSLQLLILGKDIQTDSVQLEKRMFKSIGSNLYLVPDSDFRIKQIEKKYLVLFGSGLALGIGFSVAFYFLSRNRSRSFKSLKKPSNIERSDIFQGKEFDLVAFIFNKSIIGQDADIESINKLIGVAQKNNEVQKKQRSEILISVNRKWRYIKSSNDLLIKKRRLEQDKRSFGYYIDFENLEAVRKLMK